MNRRIALLVSLCFAFVMITTLLVTVLLTAVSVADTKPAAGETVVMGDAVVVEGSSGNISAGGAPGNSGDEPEPEPVTCATPFADMVGKAVGTVDKSRFGGHSWRILHPGQMVTQEYMEGRLNLNVNEKRIITSVTCG